MINYFCLVFLTTHGSIYLRSHFYRGFDPNKLPVLAFGGGPRPGGIPPGGIPPGGMLLGGGRFCGGMPLDGPGPLLGGGRFCGGILFGGMLLGGP